MRQTYLCNYHALEYEYLLYIAAVRGWRRKAHAIVSYPCGLALITVFKAVSRLHCGQWKVSSQRILYMCPSISGNYYH